MFLAVIVFVFAFVPGILAPFTSASERHTVEVGRVADTLTHERLAAEGEPYVLDRGETLAFFGTGAPLEDDLPIDAGTFANVTLQGNPTDDTAEPETVQLCWTGRELVEQDDPVGCNTRLARGPTPPNENDATIAAFRVAWMAGEDVTLKVVMW